MYMGRKANPVASKLLADVEIKKKQEAHRKRLASMKPSLDTKPPPEHKHLYRNAKKEQLMEDRYARIEHENRLLLTKMSDIMTKKGGVDNVSTAWSYGRSLNRATRAKELRRITEDNLRILHRIQTVSPEYDHAKWEEDRLRQEKLVASICEFKKGSVGDTSARGRGLGAGSSVMSSRSRSMGPTVGGGMGGMGASSYGDEGGMGMGLGGGMGSGLMMSYGGAGASVADGGPIPGGIPGHGHHMGMGMGGAAGAYPGGSAALSAYHAEAGLSGSMGGSMGGMGGSMGGMRGASAGAGGAMGGAGGAGGYGPAPSSALSGAGAMAMGGMGGYGR